jgi:hypothetical protein
VHAILCPLVLDLHAKPGGLHLEVVLGDRLEGEGGDRGLVHVAEGGGKLLHLRGRDGPLAELVERRDVDGQHSSPARLLPVQELDLQRLADVFGWAPAGRPGIARRVEALPRAQPLALAVHHLHVENALHLKYLIFAPRPGRNPAKKGCTSESPIRVQRSISTQVGLNGDDWVYASVRVLGLTRFHVALVRFVLSERNGNGGEAMRRAGHAILARALGGSLLDPFLKRLLEIDGLIPVHGRAEAGCPPQRGGLHFPLP